MTKHLSCHSKVPHVGSEALLYRGKEVSQWRDTMYSSTGPSNDVTYLFGGLTIMHDELIASALQSLGENFVALPNPDFESFQMGKAYGNRGQCNPTYFTVGNLIKYLQTLHEEKGLSHEEIVEKYIFVTSGGCGPCRFGMYITEYRKALRDTGFEGFRIVSFEHNKGIFQSADEDGSVNFGPKFFITLAKAVIIGDIINLLTYRMRPYEVHQGATEEAVLQCRATVAEAFMQKKSLTLALYRCRKLLDTVELNRLQPKPKVMVMGEFWAAITEGDGNYNLHRFLEAEGAECNPQPLINRLMLSIWEAEHAAGQVDGLQDPEAKRVDFAAVKTKALIATAKTALIAHFKLYARAIGLHGYEIPDMKKLAEISREYYPMDCRAGEGHLEVAHLIESVEEGLAHLVISVKPFGCMPSSSVSDGIQSLVTSHFPSANFLSVETSGEGAANFYSRVQMALFKAKQSANEEFQALKLPKNPPKKLHCYRYEPHGKKIGTAASLLESLE